MIDPQTKSAMHEFIGKSMAILTMDDLDIDEQEALLNSYVDETDYSEAEFFMHMYFATSLILAQYMEEVERYGESIGMSIDPYQLLVKTNLSLLTA